MRFKDEIAKEELDGQVDGEGASFLRDDEAARRGEQELQFLVGRERGWRACVVGSMGGVAEVEGADLAVAAPFDVWVCEEGGAHGGDGDAEVLEFGAVGEDVADVWVGGGVGVEVCGIAGVGVEEAVFGAGGVLEDAEGLLCGADDGHDAVDGDGGEGCDVEFFETGGGAGDGDEVEVRDGEEAGVAHEFEAAEGGEVDVVQGAEVELVGFVELLLLGEVDALKFEGVEGLLVPVAEDVGPVFDGEASHDRPRQAQRAEIGACRDDLAQEVVRLGGVKAIEPQSANLTGCFWASSEESGHLFEMRERVLVAIFVLRSIQLKS